MSQSYKNQRPEDHMPLRAVSASMTQAVEETIEALDLSDKDAAAVRLLREYAKAIDTAYQQGHRHDGSDAQQWAMRWIAPGMLNVLESLGATPQARGIKKGDDKGDGKPNPLDELRAARTRRQAR